MSDPLDGAVATQILVVADVERARDWWRDVLGAKVHREYGGTSVGVRFAEAWVLLVTGGGPSEDKPDVTMVPPSSRTRVSHAMTVRVKDCRAVHDALVARGAKFLTPPKDWGAEVRCFTRDPDGHLVEFSEAR
jgi:catechol 2,3-dioxygenase-like lactoylglutathione lyase family enzyme